MDRGNSPLTRRDMFGLAVAALFGLAAPASASTAAEDYVNSIAEQVMPGLVHDLTRFQS